METLDGLQKLQDLTNYRNSYRNNECEVNNISEKDALDLNRYIYFKNYKYNRESTVCLVDIIMKLFLLFRGLYLTEVYANTV